MGCDKKGAKKRDNTRRGKLTTKGKELKELIMHQNRRREKKKQRKKADACVQVSVKWSRKRQI
jgi:hypothetical protein